MRKASQASASSLNQTMDSQGEVKEEIAQASEEMADEKEHDIVALMLKDKYDEIS